MFGKLKTLFMKDKKQPTEEKAYTPETFQAAPDTERRITTVWRVNGIAEMTYQITGGPHEGLVGRAFLPIAQEVTMPKTAAYSSVRNYVINEARKAVQAMAGPRGYIFGDWFGAPTVSFVRKEFAKDEQ